MIQAKVLEENTLKGCQSQKATFSDVYLVKTELKSSDLRIQAFALKKPYIVYMCIVEIHEMNITSINKIKQGRIKANEDLQPRTKPVETHYKNTYFCT